MSQLMNSGMAIHMSPLEFFLTKTSIFIRFTRILLEYSVDSAVPAKRLCLKEHRRIFQLRNRLCSGQLKKRVSQRALRYEARGLSRFDRVAPILADVLVSKLPG
jgi:hypothetical protein